MEIVKKLIPINFTKGGNKKLGIVIHTMVGNLAGTTSWFNNPSAKASAHYGVSLDDGAVYRYVEEQDQAWAQGTVDRPTFKMVLDRPGVNPNTYLISIECADDGNPAGADRSKQYSAIIELVKDIAKRNNIPLDRDHICGHREIRASKTCPGNLDVDYILNKAREAQGGSMANEYKGLDLTNQASMKAAVDTWFDVVHAKLYVKKSEADAQAKASYDAGFAAGKGSTPTSPSESNGSDLVKVDSSVWEQNGLEVTTITDKQTIKVNYRRK